MLYFAYGSNLCWPQMKQRCEDSEFLCRALLPDFRLDFTRRSKDWGGGVADIVAASGDEVWGAIYDISEKDLEALDSYEGYHGLGRDNLYNRIQIAVLEDGCPDRRLSKVWCYQVANPSRNRIAPSEKYLRTIVQGAAHWGLPLAYRNRLVPGRTIPSSDSTKRV